MTVGCIQRIITNLVFGILGSLLIYTFGFAIINRAESAEVIDRIVAVVNDDIITHFELQRSLRPYVEKIDGLGYTPEKKHQMLFKVREEILNKLVDEKIEDQEIKHHKITVSEGDIDQTIERIKEANYYTDEDLRAGLAMEGLTMDEYRDRLRKEMLRSRLVNIEVKSKIVITKEDVKSYYDSHRAKYGGEKQYHLRHIIMKVNLFADEAEKLNIKKSMEVVLEKLKEGEPFETVAITYSESPTASEGGDLGLFRLDQLSPNLREAIQGLEAGELTPVLDTDQGYQIFLVEEIVQASGRPLEEVAPEIERILFREVVNKKFQVWLKELRTQSHIKIIK